MWSVLRRYQGEEYSPQTEVPGTRGSSRPSDAVDMSPTANYSSFALNQRVILQHEAKPYAKPIDPTKLTQPYGDYVYDKLVRHMAHESVMMRRKALAFACELFLQKAEHVCASLHAGMLGALLKCIGDDDEEVRVTACAALQFIAKQPKGQEKMLETKDQCFPTFLQALNDPSFQVVEEALRLLCSLHACFNEFACTRELVKRGAIHVYVRKARSPDDVVCGVALAAMSCVFDIKEAFIEVLDADGMSALTDVLSKRTDVDVLAEAAECVTKLGFHSAGKRAAVRCGTVPHVIPVIRHESGKLRLAATGALNALTVSEEGKRQAIDSDAVNKLNSALQHETDASTLISVIKTISNLTEHPTARTELFGCIPRMHAITADYADNESLCSAAQKAIQMINWKPGDDY